MVTALSEYQITALFWDGEGQKPQGWPLRRALVSLKAEFSPLTVFLVLSSGN